MRPRVLAAWLSGVLAVALIVAFVTSGSAGDAPAAIALTSSSTTTTTDPTTTTTTESTTTTVAPATTLAPTTTAPPKPAPAPAPRITTVAAVPQTRNTVVYSGLGTW